MNGPKNSGYDHDHPHHRDHHPHDDHLGVNKTRRNIRKAPSHQPQQQQQPQALVYNINKSDFRTIVQQLTGLGSNPPVDFPPPENPHKPPNSRLVKVRPSPLTQLNRTPPPSASANPVQSDPSSSKPAQSAIPGNPFSTSIGESPISAYIRYLTEPSPVQNQSSNQNPVQPISGLFPSHQTNPAFHQSPASQFQLPPPRSPFPLLSPNFAFSPRFLGGGPQSPSSAAFFFPMLSPTWRNQ